MSDSIFVSELSVSRHRFSSYHFCRGNNSKRKSRLGLIVKGCGSYIYLGKRLECTEGDAVFIPENVYCYSEWQGEPDIEVVYLNCFMHFGEEKYKPQVIKCDEDVRSEILRIADLLTNGDGSLLESYSLFYRLLASVLPIMEKSDAAPDRTLEAAISYIAENYAKDFSVSDIAKRCCVSESTIYHLFQSKIGESPVKFANSIRINIAIEHLENSNYSISTISRLVGFNSENHFRKTFRDFTGTTPLKYRKER